MQGRNVRFQGKYDLFTIYLIPGVTIFLASFDSWTGTNLSVLGNRTGNKLLFAVWGFATGIYYCVYVRYLFHIGRYRNPGGRTLMYTAAAFLLMAVMIPYMPEKYPLKADLHVLPVDVGSLFRPLPPGSRLYHQFSGNIHHYRAVRVSALYGTASGNVKIPM